MHFTTFNMHSIPPGHNQQKCAYRFQFQTITKHYRLNSCTSSCWFFFFLHFKCEPTTSSRKCIQLEVHPPAPSLLPPHQSIPFQLINTWPSVSSLCMYVQLACTLFRAPNACSFAAKKIWVKRPSNLGTAIVIHAWGSKVYPFFWYRSKQNSKIKKQTQNITPQTSRWIDRRN